MSWAPTDRPIDLRQYWRMFCRRKGLILLCAAATFTTAAVTLVFVPKEYESQVTLMIDDSQALSADIRRVVGGVMDAPAAGYKVDEQRMGKLVGRIRSRPFLERVVRLLRMNEDPVVRARAQEKLRRQPGLSVDEMSVRLLVGSLQARIRFSSPGIGLYKVSVADYSAENAQTLARWISQLFVDVSSQSSIDRLRAAHEFGAEQARIYEEQLRKSEEALGDFKAGMIERAQARQMVRAENLPFAERMRDRVGTDVTEARDRVAASAESLSARGMESDYVSVSDEPSVRDLTGRLTAALKEGLISGLAAPGAAGVWRPEGDYPVLRGWLQQEVQNQIMNRHPEYGQEASRLAASAVFARIDFAVLKAGSELLEGAISSYRREAQSTPQDEIELARLETEVTNKRELLQSFRGQLVASDISQAVEVTNLGLKMEILDPASLPLEPSRPNKAKILLAALLLGPLIGVGIAFLSETMDPTLRSLEDFTRVMPEPVLGATPLLSRLPTRRNWLRRHWASVSLVGMLLVAGLLVAARATLLKNIVTEGRPVEMKIPEGQPHESP